MKKFIIPILLLFTTTTFSQKLPRRPKLADVRSYNRSNIMNITAGMTREEAISTMGGVKQIAVYDPSQMIGQKKLGMMSNPYSRDLKKDSSGKNIEILWYYTDIKNSSAIDKSDLTPIVFENNIVVGLGWGFFEDYAKRKQIFVNLVSN